MGLRNNRVIGLAMVAMLAACSSQAERSATSDAMKDDRGSSGLALYRAVPLPQDAVIDAMGLAGRLSIGADCVTVIEQGGRKVVPIFPLDATRRLSPSSIELFGKAYRDGDDFNASVVAAMRDFTGGAGLQSGEQAVAPGCIGDAYLKVVG